MNAHRYELIIFQVIIVLIIIVLTVYYFKKIIPLNREAKQIKAEINRCTGDERKYWKKKLKKLYLSNIPFFGKLFR